MNDELAITKMKELGLKDHEIRAALVVAKGYNDQAIADQLGIGYKTVQNYLVHVYKRTRVRSRYELILWVNRMRAGESDEKVL